MNSIKFQSVVIPSIFLFINLFSFVNHNYAQGTIEEVQVDGVIHSTDGGIKFPDNTVQTTAAYNSGPADAAPENGQPFLLVDDSTSSLISETDTVQVLAFENLGMSVDISVTGGGGSSGNPVIKSFTFTKNIDRFSPYFLLSLANTQLISEIQVSLPFTNGDIYQIYTFKEVYIESVEGKSIFNGTGYKNIEEIKFIPTIIQVETFYLDDGILIAGPTMCWHQVLNNDSCASPG